MEGFRRFGRDAVVGVLATVALVALVLGQTIVGVLVGLVAAWQLIALARGRPVLLVDQRAADREGRPNLRGSRHG